MLLSLIKSTVYLSLLLSSVLGECKAKAVLESCVTNTNRALKESCYRNEVEDFQCFCNQLPILIGCYANCADSEESKIKVKSIEEERNNYCQGFFPSTSPEPIHTDTLGNKNNKLNGTDTPTPSIDRFSVISAADQLTIQAGPTEVYVPIDKSFSDDNLPISKNVYSQYTVGTLSIGIQPTSNNYHHLNKSSKSLSSSLSSGSQPNQARATTFVAAAIAIYAFFNI